MRARLLSVSLSYVFLIACAPSEERAAPPPAAPLEWPALPVSFSGTLPCADCAGIRTTLTLLPDSTYRLRRVYLDRGTAHGDTLFVALGRWQQAADDRVALSGADGVEQFRLRSTDTLRMLDRSGTDIVSDLPYELARTASVDPIRDEARFVGAFTYLADAAGFRECQSGVRFPVLMEGDYLALERAYAAAKPAPNAPMLVRLRGRLRERPADLEGPREQDVLEVVQYLGPADGTTCP